ncbi:GPI biosynthesis protein family Pig-F-domain-containing protein [Scheffersomyces coipomensis]|uniref:GPI biosynthesis protein family Pig-F-domain-containing protein n=1 Tax=Scheffersomyces coipomensis TaxID=1788519 RepID=UPI00315CC4E0
MAKVKADKKSVTFEKEDVGNDSDATGDIGDTSVPSSTNAKDSDTLKKEREEDLVIQGQIPKLKYSLLTVPYHNLLVLGGMFYYGLTEDINTVLFNGLISLISIEVIYNYVAYGNIKVTKKKKVDNTNVPLLIGGSIITSIILSIPLFVVIIIFGAPLTNYLQQTILLSLHLSVILFNPLLISFKFDLNQFLLVFKANKIYRLIFSHAVLSSSFGIIIGTWFGVVPIPLDWDRPWQQWPLTLLVGGYVGSIVGGLVSPLVTF